MPTRKHACRTAALILLILSTLTQHPHAQIKAFETGYVDPNDLKMTTCPIDKEAHAVLLYDHGKARFVGKNNGLGLLLRYHQQIKILDQQGLTHADQQITLRRGESGNETLVNIDAITYNHVEGKIEKTPLKKADILEVDEAGGDRIVRFGMPAVRPGSIIEIVYTVASPYFFRLPAWYFQSQIPVLRSEYSVIIPQYFEYKVRTTSFFPFKAQEEKSVTETYNLLSGQELKTPALQCYWRMDSIPAFQKEAYMGPASNYKAHLDFELASYQYPGQARTTVSGTWADFTQDATRMERLSTKMDDTKSLDDKIAQLCAGKASPDAKARAIYQHLRNHLRSNGIQGLYPTKRPKQIYEDRIGSIPELHLTLLAMLRGAGIDAHPAFISTSGKGRNLSSMPLLTDYDYLAVAIRDSTNWIFLDITDPNRAYGTMPDHALGGIGVVLAPTGAELQHVLRNEKLTQVNRYTLQLNPEGTLGGTYHRELFSLAAVSFLGLEDQDRSPEFPGYQATLLQTTPGAAHEDKVILDGSLSRTDALSEVDGAYILQPLQGLVVEENPFTNPDRIYPVDIGSPLKAIWQVEITIPDGWTVAENISPAYLILPNNGGRFRFLAVVEGQKLTYSSTLSLDKPSYTREYYQGLREIFQTLQAKHTASILLQPKP